MVIPSTSKRELISQVTFLHWSCLIPLTNQYAPAASCVNDVNTKWRWSCTTSWRMSEKSRERDGVLEGFVRMKERIACRHLREVLIAVLWSQCSSSRVLGMPGHSFLSGRCTAIQDGFLIGLYSYGATTTNDRKSKRNRWHIR